MAEEDAEIALLHKMQAAQANTAQGEDVANGAEDGEQPITTENINNPEKKETVTDDQVLRALSPSAVGTVSGGGNPSFSSVPAVTVSGQEGSRSSSRASVRKPKIVGGFIADESDDEYDVATPEFTTSLQQSASSTPNPAVAPSPLHNSVSQTDVKTESPNVSTTGISTSNTLSVNPSVAGVTSSVQASLQVSNSTAPVGSMPKARLPHDKVGILEDRIQEDPRGDIESWLSLISEHRSRNKLDDARSVYQRFFQVFPQAVSGATPFYVILLMRVRLKYWLHMFKWNSITIISTSQKQFSPTS
jgi:cleavage stimulation factor subunit 3